MEESQGNQDGSRFRAFVDKVPGAVQGSNAGDMEFHQRSSGSQAARGYLNGTRPLPSEFAMYDASMIGSNQHFHDEQSLISAIESLNFRNRAADMPNNHRSAALTNGHFPSGRVDVTLNQPRATHQDEFMPRFSAACAKQKVDELALEDRGQAYSFQPHLGNFSRSSGQPNSDGISVPYHPSTATASPFQQHCYVDGHSPMYAPYDQSGSNFLPRHDLSAQPYSVMQPHYVYQRSHQINGLDVPRNRRSNQHATVCTPAGASSYLGIPNFHGLESGNHYLNGAIFQRGNGWLNSTFTDRLPSTSYTDGSCGSGVFLQFQQHEKVAYPYGPGSSQHWITGNSTICYPERTLMRPDGVNSFRSIKISPSANGCADMNQRTNGYGHNYLDIQRNNSVNLDWLKPQFLSSKSESESAMESPQLTYNSVNEVVGRICIVATDQNGCRFLQKIFTEGTKDDADKVFAEIIDHITELMLDPFAHYLVQKILDECSNDQRMRIICEITKVPADLLKVSCNMHGTRVVQKVIETINNPEQALKVISALSPGAMRLMTDPNGSHVVHRCLQKLLPEHKAFLLDAAASRHLQLARDRHGCCVLQKCIEHSNDDQRNNLLNNITSGALRLSEDQYGNYVIQFILSLKIEWATSKIVDELEGHFGNLSMQKCGSHVVEQCLKLAPQLVRDRIINELMNDPKLPQVMLDQYGNFVIQTALKESKGVQHTAFVEAIRPHAAALQSNMFGKRVLSRTYLKNKQHRLGIF